MTEYAMTPQQHTRLSSMVLRLAQGIDKFILKLPAMHKLELFRQ
jgi:hypothetical protein